MLPWAMPYESADPVPALTNYLEWIDKVGGVQDEMSVAGWLNADLLYKGLVAAGPEFTQQSVIDAINQMQWDADGIIPGVDWTIAHESDSPMALHQPGQDRGRGVRPAVPGAGQAVRLPRREERRCPRSPRTGRALPLRSLADLPARAP